MQKEKRTQDFVSIALFLIMGWVGYKFGVAIIEKENFEWYYGLIPMGIMAVIGYGIGTIVDNFLWGFGKKVYYSLVLTVGVIIGVIIGYVFRFV